MHMVVGDLEGCAVYLDEVIYKDPLGHSSSALCSPAWLVLVCLTVNLAKCKLARAMGTHHGRVVGHVQPSLVRWFKV